MPAKPTVSPDELRTIPLLRGFSDDQLASILGLLEPVGPGPVLFRQGDRAEAFYLLTGGEVLLHELGGEAFRLRPLTVIGELGALTGRLRNSTAEPSAGAELWQMKVNQLLELFDQNPQIGLGFQQNLMHVVAEKIARDQVRLQDMRANIVRTQKAMKQMRDLLLDSQDTVVSAPLHDTIEALIRQNRRVNYRVEPPTALPAEVRLDDGTSCPVVQISRTHVSYAGAGQPLAAGSRLSAVLCLSGPEIPMSGVVLRTIGDRVDVELDLLIDDFAGALEGYLTRVQMLDFLV
ncbi:MAG TPA: cyclic nucleotide-binding domain-containing protein [Kofleriaceae bacterium]|nr:cyclic nucleotide-binding domain-containing protein [Kofleriaceae bacterium]